MNGPDLHILYVGDTAHALYTGDIPRVADAPFTTAQLTTVVALCHHDGMRRTLAAGAALAALALTGCGQAPAESTATATYPLYWREGDVTSTAVYIADVECRLTGQAAKDGTQLWVCAGFDPPVSTQCVRTTQQVILCSPHQSASGLVGEKVNR